jgi:hypothetical protein
MSASTAWVPHPRRAFVFAARVGNIDTPSAPSISSANPSEETA